MIAFNLRLNSGYSGHCGMGPGGGVGVVWLKDRQGGVLAQDYVSF